MRVTVVHEFFHAIQRSYQIYPSGNGFLYELTSTWIEDVAYPDNNDYIYWTDNFFDNPEQSIDQTDGPPSPQKGSKNEAKLEPKT